MANAVDIDWRHWDGDEDDGADWWQPARSRLFDDRRSSAPWSRSRLPPGPEGEFFRETDRQLLKDRVAALQQRLQNGSDTLRQVIPDDALHGFYDGYADSLSGLLKHGGRGPGGQFENLRYELGQVVGWVDDQVQAMVKHRRDFGPGRWVGSGLFSMDTVSGKKAAVEEFLEFSGQVFAVARQSVEAQWKAAVAGGGEKELVAQWLERLKPFEISDPTGDAVTGALSALRKKAGAADAASDVLHFIEVTLKPMPDAGARHEWWPEARTLAYPSEKYSAEVTNGPKEDAMDGGGFCRVNSIPPGSCSWQFENFFDDVETALKPQG